MNSAAPHGLFGSCLPIASEKLGTLVVGNIVLSRRFSKNIAFPDFLNNGIGGISERIMLVSLKPLRALPGCTKYFFNYGANHRYRNGVACLLSDLAIAANNFESLREPLQAQLFARR